MILIFIVHIVLLLCVSRPALASTIINISISFVQPIANVVGFDQGLNGATIQSSTQYAFVELPLPAGTLEVSVVGTVLPNGAQAAACVDCSIVNEQLIGKFQPFDTSSADGSSQSQTILAGPYSLDPNAVYNLTVINTDPDPNKTLVLGSLALSIQNLSTSTTTTSSGTATASLPTQLTSMSFPTPSVSVAPTPSTSAAPSATATSPAATAGNTSQQRLLAIVLSTVLGSIALLALLFSIFCLRRRRKRPPLRPRVSDDASSSTPVLIQAASQVSNMSSLAAAEAGAVTAVRPLPQMPQMREAEAPISAIPRIKPLPPVPTPARSQETPTPPTPRTPPTPSSGSLYSSSSARLSTQPPSAAPSSIRNSNTSRRSATLNVRRSNSKSLRQYPPMPVPVPTNTNLPHISQLPREWQFYADPVLPRDSASPRHVTSPSVYSLGFSERERVERERANSGFGDREGGDVGGGFGFRLSRGTIVYPMTPSASGEGPLPDEWEP